MNYIFISDVCNIVGINRSKLQPIDMARNIFTGYTVGLKLYNNMGNSGVDVTDARRSANDFPNVCGER